MRSGAVADVIALRAATLRAQAAAKAARIQAKIAEGEVRRARAKARGVPRFVLGYATVDAKVLAKKLGAGRFALWQRLLQQRSTIDGRVTISVKWMAEELGKSYETVKEQLRGLEVAGLVARVGYVPAGQPYAKHRWDRVRRILGSMPLVVGGKCLVPSQTKAWVEAPSKRGGARPGAGRPTIKRPPVILSVLPTEEQRVVSAPPVVSDQQLSGRPSAGHAPSAHVLSLLEEKTMGKPSDSSSNMTAEQLGLRQAAGGFVIGSAAPVARKPLHPVAYGAPHPAVPVHVPVNQIAHVQVPNPPELNPSDLPGRQAHLLMRWYEGGVYAYFKKQPWVFRKERRGKHGAAAHISKSDHYEMLLAAAEKFREEDIPPAAWVAFSCDVWLEHRGEKKTLPPVAWVFSVDRIEERRGWYHDRCANYQGGRVIYTDRMREYMSLNERLRAVLRTVPADATDEGIKAVVEYTFSQKRRADLVAQIRAEAQELREQLAQRLFVGDWIW